MEKESLFLGIGIQVRVEKEKIEFVPKVSGPNDRKWCMINKNAIMVG